MLPFCWLTQFMFTFEMKRTCGGLSCAGPGEEHGGEVS